MQTSTERDNSTPLFAVLFIVIGALALWDTTDYVDSDSFVFPRTVAGAMIVLSIGLIMQWLLGKSDESRDEKPGSTLRRVALIVIMFAATAAMPWLGFVIPSLIAFAAILVTAMYDPWTPFRLIVYPAAGAGIVFGFYLLFKKVLLVPLPAGTLFSG